MGAAYSLLAGGTAADCVIASSGERHSGTWAVCVGAGSAATGWLIAPEVMPISRSSASGPGVAGSVTVGGGVLRKPVGAVSSTRGVSGAALGPTVAGAVTRRGALTVLACGAA